MFSIEFYNKINENEQNHGDFMKGVTSKALNNKL